MDGGAQPSQIAGLLDRAGDEGRAARRRSSASRGRCARGRRKLSQDYPPVFDTCGTGGDRAHTFNVSTVAALVLAACGVRVAKHGNRSVSSRCGSADLFEALGVNVAAEPAVVERCLDGGRHRLLLRADVSSVDAPCRRRRGKELGVRTAFNLLGPLTNPAGAAPSAGGRAASGADRAGRALAGAARQPNAPGSCTARTASTRSRPTGYTKVSECRDGAVNTFYLHPTDIGLTQVGARRPARRRCRRQRGDRPARPRRRAGPAARHRPAERRRRRCSSPARSTGFGTAWRWRRKRSTTAGPRACWIACVGCRRSPVATGTRSNRHGHQ